MPGKAWKNSTTQAKPKPNAGLAMKFFYSSFLRMKWSNPLPFVEQQAQSKAYTVLIAGDCFALCVRNDVLFAKRCRTIVSCGINTTKPLIPNYQFLISSY